ncbi:hypothetical protein K7X08_000296 [Anisodus acutangulus]|uniref:Uncharacterized protein n=1 Tax=Anisodus acutangulus TaxID=402998 RepID=A0A9Q1M3J4_9SOLA|nr:hypothetical protein K7X08_000296 [Anisodus acutangulus]
MGQGRPKLNQDDPKSCDYPKTRHEVDEAVADKDVDNVKRKGKEKVVADGSDDENVKKKRKSAVESQDFLCESISGTAPDTVPATPDDVDDTKVGDFCIKMDIDYKPKIDCNTNCDIANELHDKFEDELGSCIISSFS